MKKRDEEGSRLEAWRSQGSKWLFGAIIAAGILTGPWQGYGAGLGTEWKHFRGICDASAMEMLNDDLFMVADDEDNLLRVYSRSRQGFPVAIYDFSSFLGLQKKKKEIDFEGSSRIDDYIFLISSHGASKKGKAEPSRHRILVLQVTGKDQPQIRPVGFYSDLLRDLSSDPALSAFGFRNAAMLPPKSKGALNIEGLATTPQGHLLVGFRNPIPEGRALIVPILNPKELAKGRPAEFGKALRLDLNGLGIRSLASYRDGYLVVAGTYSGEEASQLYHWDGESSRAVLLTDGTKMPGNPEGVAVLTQAGREILFALSDDGTVKIGNSECKKLKDVSLKSFRGYEIPLAVQLTGK